MLGRAGRPSMDASADKPRLHILVLNDDPATLQKLASWLEGQGHTAVTARLTAMHNPEEEVARLAQAERPDVVVYDVGYPYAENWRLLESLRSKPALTSVPVVVTTASRRALESVDPRFVATEINETSEDLDDLLDAVYRATSPVDRPVI
jgi:CheY-like chemotaxis protein